MNFYLRNYAFKVIKLMELNYAKNQVLILFSYRNRVKGFPGVIVKLGRLQIVFRVNISEP